MCVVFLAIEQQPETPLILLANRDEFYDRPSAAAVPWENHPHIIAGRDLVAGGTWLGLSNTGRFAAVTNFRDPASPKGTLSRGLLVADFLTGSGDPLLYLETIAAAASQYSGFNLIVGVVSEGRVDAHWYSNRGGDITRLGPGIYGLSNHLLDTPWPKVTKGKTGLAEILREGADKESMFELLADRTLADDADLPDTGIGYEKEKLLSSIFIETPNYGTRCSTIVIADSQGRFNFDERVFV